MPSETPHVPVKGVWVRHVLAGVDGLTPGRGGNGGRFHPPGAQALYLADSEETAWAEWYRWLAEWHQFPADHLPRDLYSIAVDLQRVVDLSTAATRKAAGLPQRMRPSSRQWAAFQAAGHEFARGGAQGVLYSSSARGRSRCLCVFAAGLSCVQAEGEPLKVIAPPPPPRGMRT